MLLNGSLMKFAVSSLEGVFANYVLITSGFL